jgi:predicted site-specific integrase-resolvase
MPDSTQKVKSRQWLRPSEASKLCGLPVYTLKYRADAGILDCDRTLGGHRRYPEEAIRQLLIENEEGKIWLLRCLARGLS